MEHILKLIRTIPDFPKPGIQFRDITPLLKQPASVHEVTEAMIEPFRAHNITAVSGMEARGFIFGSLAAQLLDVSFIPLRKPGKLPYDVASVSYQLEYGDAELEAHTDACNDNDRVLLVDDLIATGGTAKASCELLEKLGGQIVGCAFLIELDDLGGREKLADYEVHSVIRF
ncbi:MAG: adenine phosphoribosyltransferase [Gammaproteobacteria bacterium]